MTRKATRKGKSLPRSPLRGRLVEEQVKELARAAGGSLTLNVGLASYG